MPDFRAKAYANRKDKTDNKKGHLQVSGTVEDFKALMQGKNKEQFDQAVNEALKETNPE